MTPSGNRTYNPNFRTYTTLHSLAVNLFMQLYIYFVTHLPSVVLQHYLQ